MFSWLLGGCHRTWQDWGWRNEPFPVFRTWEPRHVPSLGPHSVRQTLAERSRAREPRRMSGAAALRAEQGHSWDGSALGTGSPGSLQLPKGNFWEWEPELDTGTAMRGSPTAWSTQQLLTRKRENEFNQEYGQTLEERSRAATGEIQNSNLQSRASE